MDCDEDDAARRRLLNRVVEHGTLIDSLVGRLAGDAPSDESAWLAEASRSELDHLRILASSGDASARCCVSALARLERLEGVLALVLASCARSARVIADRLALAEEFEHAPSTSARARSLAEELARYGRALARA